MDIEKRKATARVWIEDVINNRDTDAIPSAYSPAFTHRSPGDHVMDRDGLIEVAIRLNASSKDRTAEVIDQIAEGDVVVTRFRSTGTWSSEAPPHRTPGVSFDVHGVTISRFEGDQIIEDWQIIDVRDESTS